MKFSNSRFKDVRELAGSIQGKSIWIVGSDPTLDSYPPDFLDGRIAITLHLAHLKFPAASWRYTSEYDRSEYLLKTCPEYARLPLISSLPHYGKTRKETEELLSQSSEVYFHTMVNYLPTGVRGEVSPEFTEWKLRQTKLGRAGVWGSHGSCLHTCWYMAVLMGVKEINLIGAGHGFNNDGGLDHFSGADGIHQNMRTGDTFSNPKIAFPVIDQTMALKRASEANGIAVNWFARYTPKMDQIIAPSPQIIEELRKKAQRNFPLIKKIYWTFWKRPVTRVISRF